MKQIIVIVGLFLSSYSLADWSIKDWIDATATTTVAYLAGGPVPAVLNLVTEVAVETVVPEKKQIAQIEKGNTEQLVAYIWSEFQIFILYGVAVFFAFTTVIAPWATQRRRRRKVKYDQYKAEAKAARHRENDGLH